jgi:N-acetylmuramoyl-L-alanine amidase
VTERTRSTHPTLLRRGDRGPRVAALREQLVRAGMCAMPSSDPDLFDDGLEHAVRTFQQRRGLAADGIVGPQTSRVVDAARWTLGDRILLHTPGHLMRGDDVAALQERLVTLGLLADPVDGIFGTRTEAALRELQASLALAPDGLCGPATLRAMTALARAVGGGDPWALRQQAAVAVAGVSLAGKVVVIDPGHGGSDPGNMGNGLIEAELVMDLGERVERRLTATGVTTVLTRDGGDTALDDATRAQLAGDVGADLVLSLHCDAHPSPQAGGVATFYWARSAVGARLARLVQSEMVARTGLRDCRTHACTFDIVRFTRMPTVQVEVGYLTNPQDAGRLVEPQFRDAVADALVIAVQRLFLVDEDAPTGALRLDDVMSLAARR